MGSSFEDLDARSSKVKTVRKSDKQFSKYFIILKTNIKINVCTTLCTPSEAATCHRVREKVGTETNENATLVSTGSHARGLYLAKRAVLVGPARGTHFAARHEHGPARL